MATVTTSIGTRSAENVDISSVSGSGPYTVTLSGAPSNTAIGDTLTDEAASANSYLITGISGADLTVTDSFGAGTAPSAAGSTQATTVRTYSTITLWEADLDDTDLYAASDDAVGECYNDSAFDEQVIISGGDTVGLGSITLTVPSAERHDGTAGSGARIVLSSKSSPETININTATDTIIEWLEIDDNAQAANNSSLIHSKPRLSSIDHTIRNILGHGLRTLGPKAYGIRLTNPTFVFGIDTENTSGGSTASDHFALPLVSSGTYDFNVDWGDGSDDDISAWDDAAKDHTYSVAGEYTVTITGTITGWRFNNSGDRLKMLDVSSWGPFTIGNHDSAFYGCSNFTSSALDYPQLDASVTTLFGTFRSCSSFTGANLDSWDVSAVTHLNYLFPNSQFNEDIGVWDTGSTTTMRDMFRSTSFNQDIGGWDVSSVTNMSGTFRSASSFAADLSSWDVSSVTTMSNMLQSSSVNFSMAGWDVSSVANFLNFMNGANALSTANYDATLIGWEALDLVDSLSCHFGDAQYSAGAAATARAAIIADDSWTITDGGQV